MTHQQVSVVASRMYRPIMPGQWPTEEVTATSSNNRLHAVGEEAIKTVKHLLPCSEKPKVQLWEVRIDDLAQDDRDCSICFQPYSSEPTGDTPLKMPCGHIFGSDCLLNWAQSLGSELTCPVCRCNPLANVLTIDKALAEVGILAYPDPADLIDFGLIRGSLLKSPSQLQAQRLDAISVYLRGEATTESGKSQYNPTVWQIMVLFRIMHERKVSGHSVALEMAALARHMGRMAFQFKHALDERGIGKVSWTENGPLVQTLVDSAKADDVLLELMHLLREECQWHPDRRAMAARNMQAWELHRPSSYRDI